MSQPNYFQHYSPELQERVRSLVAAGGLPQHLLQRYPQAHEMRSDRALYGYTMELKNRYLRQSRPLNKVIYDDKIRRSHAALGLHTSLTRIQGNRLKSAQEIRIAGLFRKAPLPFLRMIVAHELAHLRESEHNKAFFQLCVHIEPDYFQLEFDTRLYLSCLDLHGDIY